MRIAKRLVAGGVVLALALLAGCKDNGGAPQAEERNPLKPQPEDPMPKNDIQRGTQKRLVEEMMRNIGQMYNVYLTERDNRPPKTAEEFMEYLKRDATREYRALKAGTIIFVPNTPPSSHAVLAYEKDKYEKWNSRVVVFGDGHVDTLKEPEFQAALKGGGQ